MSEVAHTDYALLNPDSLRAKTEEWTARGYKVLIAPLFLSKGIFLNQVIPGRVEGLSYEYAGTALLPHPLLSHWMERQIQSLLNQLMTT